MPVKPAIPKKIRDQVQALYERGEPTHEICKTFNLSKRTVYSWADRYGWKHQRDKTKLALKVSTAEHVEQTASQFAKHATQFLHRTIKDISNWLSDAENMRQKAQDDPKTWQIAHDVWRSTVDVARKTYGLDQEAAGNKGLVHIHMARTGLERDGGPMQIIDVEAEKAESGGSSGPAAD